jgi:TM2 domain-containing membrane protein YozV/DNA-directed RNA polymerase subunit M/transcription elongation factor TFIIS
MPSVQCPGCQRSIEVTDEEVTSGLIVECSGCDSRFRVQAAAPSSVVRRAPSTREDNGDLAEREDDDRPRVKKTKFCHECGAKIRHKAVVCPECGVSQSGGAAGGGPSGGGNKVAAGICGILIGALGIHKFILGYHTAGVIMLLVSVIGGACTLLVSTCVMGIIGFIEGIIYLSKSDEEFYRTYVVGRKEWF